MDTLSFSLTFGAETDPGRSAGGRRHAPRPVCPLRPGGLRPWTHPDDRAAPVCLAPAPDPGMGRTCGEASVRWGKTPWWAPSKRGW